VKTIYDANNNNTDNNDNKSANHNLNEMITIDDFAKVARAIYKLKMGDNDELQCIIGCVCGKDKEKAKNVTHFIKEIMKTLDLQTFKNLLTINFNNESNLVQKVIQLYKTLEDGLATEKDLFVMCDWFGDRSGTVGFDEFMILARRLGTPLTEHQVQELFASMNRVDVIPENLELNEEEFSKAIVYLREQHEQRVLNHFNITPTF